MIICMNRNIYILKIFHFFVLLKSYSKISLKKTLQVNDDQKRSSTNIH